MNISVVGGGYVGATVAACLADEGHEVVTVDVDEDTVTKLNAGEAPIHEAGLPELIDAHAGPDGTGRLEATTDYDAVLDTAVTFLCLPTPQRADGNIDLSMVKAGVEHLGETLAKKDNWHTVVIKSTVVPRSTEDVITPFLEAASGKQAGVDFGVGVSPEFQREGTAVADFRDPDKVVFGTDDPRVLADVQAVFASLVDASEAPVVETDTRTAEMIKYANNTFLAAKVSLINELGNICKLFDTDAYEVANAIALDDRIGERFLRSGVGYGGSCFPKDTAAIIAAAAKKGYDASLLRAVTEVNDEQPKRLLELAEAEGDLTGKRVAVLGLAFKPGTDDVRNSRAIPVLEGLEDRGADVVAYDPVAADGMCERFPRVEYARSAEAALTDAHAALVVTGWDEFEALDEEFDAMARPVVIDGRRVVDRREGLTYEGLTW
jgi:UDPglucose 6-dehydrogenase